MTQRARAQKGKVDACPPTPKHAPPPIFQPLPPHPVGRWRHDEARAETVEQLLYGPVHTRRPALVCATLDAEAEAALGVMAEAQLFDGGAEMAAAYKAVVYGLRDGWESCPLEVSSVLAEGLPRWLVPRVAGDLLGMIPASAASRHGETRRSGRCRGRLRGSGRPPACARLPSGLQSMCTAARGPPRSLEISLRRRPSRRVHFFACI